MKLRKTGMTLVFSAAMTSALPTTALAQTCSQTIASLQSKASTLDNEARANNVRFLADEAITPALGAAQRSIDAAGDPTVEAYNQMRDAKAEVEAWAARINSFDGFLSRLKVCMATNCNMLRFLDDENQRMKLVESVRNQVNEWVQSLGNDGITAAAERVNRASAMVSNTASGALGIAQGGATDALNCMNQYLQRTPTGSNGNAVDLGNGPASPAGQRPAAGGGGAGRLIGMGLGIAGAGVAGLFVANELGKIQEEATPTGSTTTTTAPPPSGGGGSVTYRAQVTDTCTPGPTGDPTLGQIGTPCSRVLGGPCGAAPAAFNFTVANGAVTNQCWLSNANVASGTYTGQFTGTTCDDKSVSGPLPGTWTMTCTEGRTRPATHRVTIVVTRVQ